MRHSHSFLGGFIGGLVLDQETFAVLLIGIAVGASAGFLIREGVALGRWVRDRLERAKPYDWNKPW